MARGWHVLILGIDPGPLTCGVVLYDTKHRRVIEAHKDYSVEALIASIQPGEYIGAHIAIETITPGPRAGSDVIQTAIVVGRLYQRALDARRTASLHRRADVVRYLGAGGKGSDDSRVMHALIDIHGPAKAEAVGRKIAPGPLYGVSSHAWQALGVAYVAGATRAWETP